MPTQQPTNRHFTASPPAARVLIIEDSTLMADLLTAYLVRDDPHAWHITYAATLTDAVLWIAAHGVPDLVCLDLNLPDSRSLATLQRLFAALPSGAPTTPILVITGEETPDIVAGTVAFGAGFLGKMQLVQAPAQFVALARALVAQGGVRA